MQSFFLPSSFGKGTRGCFQAPTRAVAIAAAGLVAALCAGCGGSGSGSGAAGGGGSGGNGSAGGDTLFGTGVGAGPGSNIPPDSAFIQAEIGAFARGNQIDGQSVDTGVVNSGNGCDTLVGVVRDFKGAGEPAGHPDFQSFSGSAETPGLVGAELGADHKPVYTSECEAPDPKGDCPFGEQTTSKDAFAQWYKYVPGLNIPYLIYFKFEPQGGISTFESKRFFPMDDAGWGNSGMDQDDKPRNFHFTTELHTTFKYQGGETFRFSGDDDLWVFINGKLAIDLGGLHPAVNQQIDLDKDANKLGIEKGNIYSLELFHAERHTSASNFRVDTNLAFVDCGAVLPDPK